MIDKLFRSGNYNEWNRFISETLPAREAAFKDTVIANIDKVLVRMLGQSSNIEKTAVDAQQICDRRHIVGVRYNVTYTINDFMVPDAPAAAIAKDTEAIKQSLLFENFTVKDISINVQNGTLKIMIETFFE